MPTCEERMAVEAAANTYQTTLNRVKQILQELGEAKLENDEALAALQAALDPILADQPAIVLPYVYAPGRCIAMLARKTSTGIVVESLPRLEA